MKNAFWFVLGPYEDFDEEDSFGYVIVSGKHFATSDGGFGSPKSVMEYFEYHIAKINTILQKPLSEIEENIDEYCEEFMFYDDDFLESSDAEFSVHFIEYLKDELKFYTEGSKIRKCDNYMSEQALVDIYG